MHCEEIHLRFIKDAHTECPFCNEKLVDSKSLETRCCGRPNITIDSFKIVCTNCGSVHGYKSASEFIDFYENMHKIRKKSVYHRKYRIFNVINDIAQKNWM